MTPFAVSVGECMLELARDRRAGGGWRLGHGGDAYNTAVHLARLGVPTGFLSALGDDPWSAELLAAWRAEGVDTSLVLTVPGRLPGLYAIRTGQDGERRFDYWRGESAARALFEADGIEPALERTRSARLLYLSGITLSLFGERGRERLAELAATVRAAGGVVAFDPNYRARGWASANAARAAITAFAPYVTIALPTHEDEAALHGDPAPADTAARWLRWGAREVAVKTGPEGAVVIEAQGLHHVRPAAPVPAVDTTGAGDAFNGGYLAARMAGHSPAVAAAFGNRMGGETVRHPGAIMPAAVTPALAVPAEIAGDCA